MDDPGSVNGFPGENKEAHQYGQELAQNIQAAKLNQAYTNSLNWDGPLNMMRGSTLGAMWAELEQNTDQVNNTVKWMILAL
jgi:hypothetical protein